MEREVLYRAEAKVRSRVACFDEWTGKFTHFVDAYNPTVDIHYLEYPIIRRTPKGAWISVWAECRTRFVLLEANKRFACPAKEEALESLRARSARRAKILKAQLRDVEIALAHIEKEQSK